MNKIEKAKDILQRYRKNGFEYASNLMDTNRKFITEQKTLLKFIKYNKTKEVLSEKLANQIINYDLLGKRVERLGNFVKQKSRTEEGILMFTYKVTPDYNAVNYAEYLQSVGIRLLRVIRQNKDNDEFDEKLSQFNEIYNKIVEEEPIGDYGVVFSYSIVSILPLSKETEEAVKYIESIADNLLAAKSVKQNKTDMEREI